jgi:cysteine synthase
MDNLLSKHPEILRFDEDRVKISKTAVDYLQNFNTNFPEIAQQSKVFRERFSQMETFSHEKLKNLEQLHGFTYTQAQREFLQNQLSRIADNYPVPEKIKGKVKPGEYLDLRNETDVEIYQNRLKEFGKLVQSLPKPAGLDIDVSKVGKLSAAMIHGSEDFNDPQLSGKVDKVWTLDISMNLGISIKDIMAFQMIEDAVNDGRIDENSIVVEGTSGNTGAGLAVEAARRGMKLILIIPDKMSREKIDRLKDMGAHTIVTPTKVDADDPKSYYSVREFMAKEIGGWAPNQYDNLSNSKGHERVTGPQIWEQTGGEVTAVIATAGTCGTISGIGRYLKSKNPDIKMIAVDTIGSILYLLKEGFTIDEVQKYAKGYKIQGFGEDIHPKNMDLSVIDHFIRVGDMTGLNMTRILPQLGFVMGQSSGAAYAGLLESVEKGIIGSKDKVIVIFPDTGIAYRADVYSDSWMREMNFLN